MARAAASASPEPGPVIQRGMDESVAKAALRDFLSSIARPCAPPMAKKAKVQRTLMEAWQSVETSDVLTRVRCDDVCRYQAEHSCACAARKGSRDVCSFAIDRRFEKQLADFSPAASRHYVARGLDALLVDLKEVLCIHPSAKLRKQSGSMVVYGWRRVDG